MVRECLQDAIRLAGSEAKLGEATGYSQNAIWQAKQRGRVTPTMAMKIERATGVSRRELCPDFPWDDAGSPESVAVGAAS